MKIISVVGARPNFMKIAPFIRAIENHNTRSDQNVEHILVHTDQRSMGIPWYCFQSVFH